MLQRSLPLFVAEYNFGHPSLRVPFVDAAVLPAAITKFGSTESPRVTVAPNGARVITQDFCAPQCSIGVYIKAGAKFDPLIAPGLSYVMRWGLTTSNMENALFQLDRTLRATGAAQQTTEIRKKLIGVRVDARLDMWKAPTENLFTGISAPRFAESDIERFRDTMDNLLEEMKWQRPREYCEHMVETIAFFKNPLGNPRHVLPSTNDRCSSKMLIDHWAKYCIPSRVIIAGVNVEHQALLAAYEGAPFPHSEQAPHHVRSDKSFLSEDNEETQYTPGREEHQQEDRAKEMGTKPDMEKETIAAMAYRCFGADGDLKDYAAALVAEQAANILIKDSVRYERFETAQGLRAFYKPFSTCGLIGFSARGSPEDCVRQVKDGVKLFRKLPAATIDAAKVMATVDFFNEDLEVSRKRCDFLASSLKETGTEMLQPDALFSAINSVTQNDLERLQKYIDERDPCFWVTGETFAVPALSKFLYE